MTLKVIQGRGQGHGASTSSKIANFNPAFQMVEEIEFENGHLWTFGGSVPLTLTLDDLHSHIVRFVSSTSIHITIGYMAPLSLIVTNGRTDDKTFFTHVNRSSFAKQRWPKKCGRTDGNRVRFYNVISLQIWPNQDSLHSIWQTQLQSVQSQHLPHSWLVSRRYDVIYNGSLPTKWPPHHTAWCIVNSDSAVLVYHVGVGDIIHRPICIILIIHRLICIILLETSQWSISS